VTANTTDRILRSEFTAKPVIKCCGAPYGVDYRTVRAAKVVSLRLARHRSACLSHVSANGAIITATTAHHRRLPRQNLHKSWISFGQAWPNFQEFALRRLRIHPDKNVSQVSEVCLLVGRFPTGIEQLSENCYIQKCGSTELGNMLASVSPPRDDEQICIGGK